MTPHPPPAAYRRAPLLATLSVGLLAGIVSMTACDAGRTSHEIQYALLPQDSVSPLRLHTARTLVLGTRLADSPTDVADIVEGQGRLFVVDPIEHVVLSYGADGALLFRIGDDPTDRRAVQVPRRLELVADTLYVADQLARGLLMRFDLTGHQLADRIVHGIDFIADFKVAEDRLVVAQVPDPNRSSRDLVVVLDSAGRTTASGCETDARYTARDNAREMLRMFALPRIQLDRNMVYCVQPISPHMASVNVLTGARDSAASPAPPFYQPPPPAPATTNAKVARQYAARWTAHQLYHPTDQGFISVFTQFDTTTQTTAYRVFARVGGRRGTYLAGVTEGRLLRISGDTLILARREQDGHCIIEWKVVS